MKPEYIGIKNFDTDNYVYARCKCPLPMDYAIKWPRIKDGKPHRYTCTCEDCGTEVGVISKSYGPEVQLCGTDDIVNAIKNGTPHETVTEFADRCKECGREKVVDKIRAEIEAIAFDSLEIDGEIVELNDVLQIIDKYKAERRG